MAGNAGDYEQADVYRAMRAQVLTLTTEVVQPRSGMLVLLMETGYEEAAVTVLAVADGSASMYFSTGGGLIGAGEYEAVREVVFETLAEAETHLPELERTDEFPLPGPDRTRFYAVTEQGVVHCGSGGKSPW